MKARSVHLLSIILFALSIHPFVVFAQQVLADTGEIHGVVYLRGSLKRLATIGVRLIKTEQHVLTDENGEFRFGNLPVGEYTLTVLASSYHIPEDEVVTVKPGQTTKVRIYLERIEFLFDEIFVTSPHFQVTVSRQNLQAAEINRIPGTAGDAFRALQALPGIGVANDFDGRLYIRGGGPEDNLFYFDRTPLGYPYHFGALVATISSEVINHIDVYAGGFGAEFGSNAQAVIDIHSRRGRRASFGGKFNANPLYSEGLIEGPIGKRGSWYLAARRSYVDLLPIEVKQITAFPRFWDYQMKTSFDLSTKHQLNLSAVAADDFFVLKLGLDDVNEDPTLVGKAHFKDSFSVQGIHLRSTFTDSLTSNLSISRGDDTFDIEFGDGYFMRFEPTQYALREDLTYRLTPKHQLESGLLFSTGQWRASSFFSRPPDEGSPGFIFTFEEKVELDVNERFDLIEGYLQSRHSLFAFLSIGLGLRLNYFNLTEQLSVVPRGSIKFNIPNGPAIRFAYGKYEQSPHPYHILPKIGNPDVKQSEAVHYILEVERQLSQTTGLKVAGYHKELRDLITRGQEFAYLNQGEGLARGLEVFLHHRARKKFFGWASYAYSVSKRRDSPSEKERLYSYDQTHVATLTASYKPTPTWEIGAKWQYSTGNPYTPVINADIKPHPVTGSLLYVPIYGETNSARLPPFHRLDFRINKSFIFNNWQMGIFLEILNAYNRKNVLTYDYNNGYTEREAVHQLPLMPYLGMTVEF